MNTIYFGIAFVSVIKNRCRTSFSCRNRRKAKNYGGLSHDTCKTIIKSFQVIPSLFDSFFEGDMTDWANANFSNTNTSLPAVNVKETAKDLDIAGGVKITTLSDGKLNKQTNVREGFIITKVNGKTVKTIDQLVKTLENVKGGVMLEGIYEDYAGTYYYAFAL